MAKYDLDESDFDVAGARIGIVTARFNHDITDALLARAQRTLGRFGIPEEDIVSVRVPGAFELPLVAKRLATHQQVDAVITLGAVVRGDTPHFDYVCSECARGVLQVGLECNLPVIFGVLTTDNQAQARERIGGRHGHKGEEAALAALETLSVLKRLEP